MTNEQAVATYDPQWLLGNARELRAHIDSYGDPDFGMTCANAATVLESLATQPADVTRDAALGKFLRENFVYDDEVRVWYLSFSSSELDFDKAVAILAAQAAGEKKNG